MSLAHDQLIMKRRAWLVDYLASEGGYTPSCEIAEAMLQQSGLFQGKAMHSARVSVARLVRALEAEGYIAVATIGVGLVGYGVTPKCHPLPERYRDRTGRLIHRMAANA